MIEGSCIIIPVLGGLLFLRDQVSGVRKKLLFFLTPDHLIPDTFYRSIFTCGWLLNSR